MSAAELPPNEGFNVYDDHLQGACLTIFFIFTPLTIFATALRFYSSRVATGRNGIEDWLALGALIMFLAWISLSSVGLATLNGRDASPLTMTLDEISYAFRMIWAASIFFAPNQFFAKLSILFLYYRLFGVNQTYVRWIKGIGLFTILWSIQGTLVVAFECRPIWKYWTPWYLEGYCINIGAYLAVNESLNSLADFVMAGLAIVMLRQLHTKRYTKWKLGIVFGFGGFAGIIGFIKIGLAFEVNVHNQIQMGLWATLQMAFSIICCCAITYGPLFAKSGILGRYTHNIHLYGTRTRTQGASRADNESRNGYIDLEGAGGSRGRVDTSIGIDKSKASFAEDNSSEHKLVEPNPGFLMKTVRVHQEVEHTYR